MIIYGSRGKYLHSEQVSGIKCSHCEQNTTHTISIFGRYAHIYWIPFFPMGKKGVSECNNCKITLEPKNMSESLKLAYQNVNGNAKSPIWFWSGLGVIGLIIAASVYSQGKHDQEVPNYLDNPQIGDIYEYKPSENHYSLIKVSSVTQDSVFVIDNNYEIDRQSSLDEIDIPSNYTTEPYGISRVRIKELFESKEILDVNRN